MNTRLTDAGGREHHTTHGTCNVVPPASSGYLPLRDPEFAHSTHLSSVAAAVWYLSDGTRTVAEIAQEAATDEKTVRMALFRLEDVQLLDRFDHREPSHRRLINALVASTTVVLILMTLIVFGVMQG